MADDNDKPNFLSFWTGPEGDRVRRQLRHPTQPYPEDLADQLEAYKGKPIPADLFDHLLATLRGQVERPSGHLARDAGDLRDRATALRWAMEEYPRFLARARKCKAYLHKTGKLHGRANAIWRQEPNRIAAYVLIQRWGPLQGLSPASFLNALSKLRRG